MKANVRGYEIKMQRISGKGFSFDGAVKKLCVGQDLRYWKLEPDQFEIWIKSAMKNIIDNLFITIE
jgi:hypothetical protein